MNVMERIYLTTRKIELWIVKQTHVVRVLVSAEEEEKEINEKRECKREM